MVLVDGKVYVADADNNNIRVIDLATMGVTTFAGSTTKVIGSTDDVGTNALFFRPDAITTDGAGNLYVADSVNYTVRAIEIASARVTTLAGTARMFGTSDGVGSAALFEGPSGVEWDGNGFLYVCDRQAHTIRRIFVATGAVSTFAGQPGRSGTLPGSVRNAVLNGPSAIRIAPSGQFIIANEYENTILSLTQQ
jgi:DNA-binding beta-propeller fold protein YncE